MNSQLHSFHNYVNSIQSVSACKVTGKIQEAIGVILTSNLKNVKIGEICTLKTRTEQLDAEVVGFRKDKCLLMPFGYTNGIGPDTEVEPTGRQLRITCGEHLKGAILDGLGRSITPQSQLERVNSHSRSINVSPPNALERLPIKTAVTTGIAAIDAFLTLGRGQRMGIFAAAGAGKSTLIGNITQHVDADIVVINLIGERGREIREFIDDNLSSETRRKSVVIYATSDQPAIVRLTSAYTATTIAEYFRDQGLNVLLVVDSITRFARALREIGLARGEVPARGGYPPSVFAELPRLLERSGNNDKGSITALYTVLVSGDDLTEPIADEVMSIIDGHIVLTRELAEKGHYPAIDILKSKSRVMNRVTSRTHQTDAARLLRLYATSMNNQESIRFGFYKKGNNKQLDRAVTLTPLIDDFLCSAPGSHENLNDVCKALHTLADKE